MNSFRAPLACVLLASVLCSSPTVFGSTNTWVGPTAGYWGDVNSWSPAALPSPLSDVLLNGSAATLTNTNNDQARSLTVTNNNFTLLGGNLFLGGLGAVDVAASRSLAINSLVASRTGLVKSGGGTLSFGGTNLVTGGIALNAGFLNAGGAPRISLGNNALTLNGGELILGWNTSPVFLREFGGAGNVFNAARTDILQMNISALNSTVYSGGAIGSAGQGVGINKTGPGTLSFTGGIVYDRSDRTTAVWSGGLTFGGASGALLRGDSGNGVEMYGGVFTLDETAADIDRYGNAMAVNAQSSGTFRYLGAVGTTSSETLGSLTHRNDGLGNERGSTLNLVVTPGSGGTAVLTFASFLQPDLNNWNNQRAVNFLAGSGTLGNEAQVIFTTDPTKIQNGLLNAAYANGTDFAAYDTDTDGAGPDTELGVVPFTAYINPANVNTPGATDTVLINSSTTVLTLTGAKQYNALKMDGTQILDLAGFNLTLGTAAGVNALAATILKTGAGQAEITGSGGEILAANDVANFPTHYNIRVDQGTLKISTPLDGNSNGRLQLLKSGTGLLWLTPNGTWQATDSFSAGLSVAEGAVRLNPTDTDFGNLPFVLLGGVFELADGLTWNPTIGTGNANVRWLGNGGFAAWGADAIFAPNITWNAANHIPDGAALLLNSSTADSKITLAGTLNLGADATKMYLREISVADNPNSATDFAEISGQVISETNGVPTYTYHLVKTGAGTLSLAHANNNYSGAAYVKEGTLAINGALAAPANSTVAFNPDYTAVHVMNGGTLGGTGTIDRLVYVEVGGVVAPGNSPGILTVNQDIDFAAGAVLQLEINGLAEGTAHDQLKLTAGDLALGDSTLSLSWGAFALPGLPGDTNFVWIVNNAGGGSTLGQFAGLIDNALVTNVNGAAWFITYDASYGVGVDGGNDVLLYAIIPEPSTWLLVAFGLLGVVGLRRRASR